MALFGKRKHTAPDHGDEVDQDAAPAAPEGEPGVDRDWDRTVDGPFDITEAGALKGRVDLGPLRVPAVKGMELRLDLEEGTNKVVGVTCTIAGSKTQLQAFAAPKSNGLWAQIRPQIVEGLVNARGKAEVVDGVMGKEVLAQMPGRGPDGRTAYQPARFIGVDGPRWFLRAVINGPAATNPQALQATQAFLRHVVVDRGEEPRPPREVLYLTPPSEFVEEMNRRAAARKAAAAAPKGDEV